MTTSSNSSNRYDAIIVGARCAGSPTAMLLARKGYKVLVVDKATFPSDTFSTHFIHAPGMAALRRWGLADRVAALNCPAVKDYSFDFGFFTVTGSPKASNGEGSAVAYAPRRYLLDKLLLDAAVEAGAEVREGFGVDEITTDDDGTVTGIRNGSVTEKARVVIGADGRHSMVAKAVRAPVYNERPPMESPYYTYWSGIPTEIFEVYIRDRRGWGVFPTNDGLTVIVVGWPIDEFKANRGDVEGNYLKALDQAPELASRVRAGRREDRFHGAGDLGGFFRVPYGPGWVLVGDAAYHKDPITAQGISDAFHDTERLVDALDAAWSGRVTYDTAMAEYQRARDEHVTPMYELTCQFASMEPPPPERQQLLAAVSRNADASDAFASMMAGTLPVPAFFSPERIGQVMADDATTELQGLGGRH